MTTTTARTRSPIREAAAELERLKRTRKKLSEAYALKLGLIDADIRATARSLVELVGAPLVDDAVNGEPAPWKQIIGGFSLCDDCPIHGRCFIQMTSEAGDMWPRPEYQNDPASRWPASNQCAWCGCRLDAAPWGPLPAPFPPGYVPKPREVA